MRWPNSVPVLCAEDICQDQYDGPKGTHCLVGWAREVFGEGCVSDVPDRVFDALRDAVGDLNVAYYNDSEPKPLVADKWNQAMRSLGYTEVEDA